MTTQPASGLAHIDALLNEGPGWNWVAPGRTTLYYSFALTGGNASDAGAQYTGSTAAFNATQQAAAFAVMAKLTAITGINFAERADGNTADIHFAAVNLVNASTAGFCSTRWSYSFNGDNTITSYTADAWVYLDNAELAGSNHAPTAGSVGFEVLLHEIGHALGLKHPFEGDVQLPDATDTTAFTVMSYTHVGGPYQDYNPYDIAALMFLFGGDGLAGALGQGSDGLYLIGTAAADRLSGSSGNDSLNGGAGIDTAVFSGARSRYRLSVDGASIVAKDLQGSEGEDQLSAVERIEFSDGSLAFDLDGHAGLVARLLGAVFGPAAVGNAAYVGIGLDLADAGSDDAALGQLALEARLGVGFSSTALVQLLYANVTGVAPGAADLAFWVGTLQSGQYTPMSLTLMAAALELNAQNIDLVGLAETGLAFS